VPASLAKVGMRSIVQDNLLQVLPAGIFPGHRMMQGMRMPPSVVLPFQPERGRLLPPHLLAAPLSEVKTT